MKKIRHFLDIDKFSTDTIKKLLLASHKLKNEVFNNKNLLKKILVMVFEKPSTRTRLSFEIGMKQLHGEVVILDQNDTQLGRGESIKDTIRVISKYADIIMYRGSSEERLDEIVKVSEIPVINGLTDKSHPCQIMADIMTLEEKFKSIDGLKITWIGDGNNVCNSWIHASKHFNFNYNISCPKGFFPKEDVTELSNVKIFDDPLEAAKGADVIITDTWVSMGMVDEKERLEKFKGFQVNKSLMNLAKSDAVFMHCLPAHRGIEVADEIIDGPQSLVWQEAHNRLFVQKAILLWCLKMNE